MTNTRVSADGGAMPAGLPRRSILAGLAALPIAAAPVALAAPLSATHGGPAVALEARYWAFLPDLMAAIDEDIAAHQALFAEARRVDPDAQPSTSAWSKALEQAGKNLGALRRRSEARIKAAWAEHDRIYEAVADAPATSWADIAAKARMARWDRTDDVDGAIAASLVCDLLTVAGQPDFGVVEAYRARSGQV